MLIFRQCKVLPKMKVIDTPRFVSMSLIPYTTALDSLSPLETQAVQPDVFSTPPKLDGDLITLTLLPRTKWQTLLNFEVIQVYISVVTVPLSSTDSVLI